MWRKRRLSSGQARVPLGRRHITIYIRGEREKRTATPFGQLDRSAYACAMEERELKSLRLGGGGRALERGGKAKYGKKPALRDLRDEGNPELRPLNLASEKSWCL